jgi:uncharacterized membrane protein YphA (DoxX/SURF4 family)
MAVLHFFGRVFMVLALVFLALGVFVWLDGRATLPAGRVWFETHSPSLGYAEVIVSRHLGAPDFWQDKALPYLKRDAWEALLWPVILFLILGGLLLLIGRRRRRRSGFH